MKNLLILGLGGLGGLGLLIGSLLSPLIAHAVEIDFENDSNLPIVYINAAIKGGSVTDPAGQEGIANFVGEMLLRGTQFKSKKEIDLILDQMGARIEVEARAESLIIRGAVLSSQLDNFLPLMSEIITAPNFPEDQIVKLKSEIISGIQEELGHDASLASRKFIRFLFQNHPYGKSPMGKSADIQSLTKENILSNYKKLFRQDSLLVIGSGDASREKISNWATSVANSLNPADGIPLELVNKPEDLTSTQLQIIDKPDRTQTQIHIGQIGIRMTDKDFFPLYVGNHAFGGASFAAILTDEIRVKRGWSYGANSSFRQGLQPRSWHMHLYPASKDTVAALSYSLKLISDLKTKGLTEKQFNFARTSLLNSAGFTYNTPKKRVENKLLERTLNLPTGFIKSFGTEIEKVTMANTNSALSLFLKPTNLAVSVLSTSKNLKEGLAKAAGVALKDVKIIPFTQE
ncbi:MAG: pitrilysin family protein [Bdellovibrionia bacterium]